MGQGLFSGGLPPYPRCLSACRGQHWMGFKGPSAFARGCGGEQLAQRVMAGQQHPHAAGVAHDGRADLEQLGADRGGAGLGQLGALQAKSAQVDHQGVGQRRQQQAQLIGLEAMATRAPAEQIELRFLDPVLGLAACAVPPLVQRLGRARQIGDDEARVGALLAVLQPCDDATRLVPGAWPRSSNSPNMRCLVCWPRTARPAPARPTPPACSREFFCSPMM